MPYPPPPGPRIAYDVNGSIGLARGSDGVIKDFPADALKYLNGDLNHILVSTSSYYGGDDHWLVIVFPVPMRLYGAFVRHEYTYYNLGSYYIPQTIDLWTAPDTTNGDDGVWTKLTNFPKHTATSTPNNFNSMTVENAQKGTASATFSINDQYRRTEAEGGIVLMSGTPARHVKGVKIKPPSPYSGNSQGSYYFVVHLYGEPDTDSSDNILIFYDPTEESYAQGNMLDWGDVPQGSSATKRFRLLNNSAGQTARNIVISAQMGLATTSPIPSDSFLFSLDGNTWTTTVTLVALSPGAVSGQVYVRRVTPINAQPSNWAPKVVATVGSWS